MRRLKKLGEERFEHRRVFILIVTGLAVCVAIGYAAARLGSQSGNSVTAPTSQSRSILLLGDGVAGARFWQNEKLAITDLERALGAPSSTKPIDTRGNCTIDATLSWPMFTAYFYRQHFVGYGYSQARYGYGDARNTIRQTLIAVTTRGLRLGDTITRARQIYGAIFSTSYAQGGSWSADTPTGTLDGYLTSEVQAKPAAQIASIGAGSVGCPAASP